MPQQKILVDSNAYFRLARDIHPLLGVEICEQKYCFYIIDGFEEEYLRSSRLKTKFNWVNDEQYKNNRDKEIHRSKKEKEQIVAAREFMADTAIERELTTSPVDVEALATAYVLKIPIVTDDAGMNDLANEYGISVISSLETMRRLKECGRIDMDVVRAIAGYWKWLGDLPRNFKNDYKRLFGEEPPSAS